MWLATENSRFCVIALPTFFHILSFLGGPFCFRSYFFENTNLTTKNSYYVELRIYRSIFKKIWTMLRGPWIGYTEFIWHQKHRWKKNHSMYKWGSTRWFSKIQNFARWTWNWVCLALLIGDSQLYIVWIFNYYFCVPDGKKPYIPNFNTNDRKSNILENRFVDPQLTIKWKKMLKLWNSWNSIFSITFHYE